MPVTIPRALAVLAAVWMARDVTVVAQWQGLAILVGLVWTGLWGVAAAGLWQARSPALAGLLLAALSLSELVLMDQWPEYALILLAWAGTCLVVTAGRPAETVLAIRVLVTTVYVFGALTKVQPSWLAGENIRYLLNTRPQAELLLPFVGDQGLTLLAVGTVLAELWLGIGLWFRRTRVPTAALGVLLHAGLLVLASRGGVAGALHLVVLNFGLVLLYVSFWEPVRARHELVPEPALSAPARGRDSRG